MARRFLLPCILGRRRSFVSCVEAGPFPSSEQSGEFHNLDVAGLMKARRDHRDYGQLGIAPVASKRARHASAIFWYPVALGCNASAKSPPLAVVRLARAL